MSIKIHHHHIPSMFNPSVMLNPLARVQPGQNSVRSPSDYRIAVKGLGVMFI